jgi:hypothetical protein
LNRDELAQIDLKLHELLEEKIGAGGRSWGEALLEVAGTAEGLPPDYAENHDHYLHGLPRRWRSSWTRFISSLYSALVLITWAKHAVTLRGRAHYGRIDEIAEYVFQFIRTSEGELLKFGAVAFSKSEDRALARQVIDIFGAKN